MSVFKSVLKARKHGRAVIAIAALAAAVAACGGGHDDDNGANAGTPPPTGTNPGGGVSVDGFITVVKALIATTSETTEPSPITDVTATTSDTTEPDPNV